MDPDLQMDRPILSKADQEEFQDIIREYLSRYAQYSSAVKSAINNSDKLRAQKLLDLMLKLNNFIVSYDYDWPNFTERLMEFNYLEQDFYEKFPEDDII